MSTEGHPTTDSSPTGSHAAELKGMIKESIRELLQEEPTLLTPGGRRVAPQDQAEGDHREGK